MTAVDDVRDASTPLDALRMPLHGSRLIEASAGTGKTWTIAALYLRLVLGHGEEGSAFQRHLLPSEILVMTFTVAATRELSDRIRKRLIEGARCFRGEAAPDAGDVFLQQLIAAYPEGQRREEAAWRLATAAESMDDAAIHTIDAWCQRMLTEHAFDSGNLFDEELMADETEMLEEACRDYWRQQIYPLSGVDMARALAVWPNVQALIDDVSNLQRYVTPEQVDTQGEATLAELIGLTAEEHARALAELKQGWDARARDMLAWIEDHLQRKPCPFDRRKLKSNTYPVWLQALEAWALDPELAEPDLSDAAVWRLTPAGMEDARVAVVTDAKGLAPYRAALHLPDHFAAFQSLAASLAALPVPDRRLRLHAAACVMGRLRFLKAQSGTYGFKDLVERLAEALQRPNGEHLREGILRQYPVALIDEFQDTSPAQYAVFDSVYRTATNDPRLALFFIGDPKQSIYGFRGADIESYLRAREATRGRHYMLGTNFRSSHALVSAVNSVFGQAEAAHAEGAFLFGRDSRGASVLPFERVEAHGRKAVHMAAGEEGAALRVVVDAASATRPALQKRFAARCAEDIVRMLNDPHAGFHEPGSAAADAVPTRPAFTRLRPGDIAVLVRDRREAASVREQLQARGVASVYLSDQESVFRSAEAADLLRWLRAVEQPRDVRLVRSALATAMLGLSVAELARLASDDEAFEAVAEQMRRLHEVWQRQGVLTMLRRTLHLFDLPGKWLQQPGGERRLTNHLHLAELVESAAGRLDGEMSVIHWLRDQTLGKSPPSEERIVRLESDAGLVQVITVHKSKGLEYPVVYLPFVTAHRVVDRKARFVAVPDGQGGRHLDFRMAQDTITLADRERLKEDLRLLYVALTRARHSVWVGVGAISSGDKTPRSLVHNSAWGYLLGGGRVIEGSDLEQAMRLAFGDDPAIEITRADRGQEPRTMLVPRDDEPPLGEAPVYDAAFPKGWSVGSFSAMVRHIAHLPAGQLMNDVAREEELLSEPLDSELQDDRVRHQAVAEAAPWHRFPRGAWPGNFLHDQLEWLGGEGFALAQSQELAAQLHKRCERQGWAARAEDVVTWMTALVATPLGGAGATLEQVGELGSLLPEMEFWFPSEGLDSAALDDTCRQHLLSGRPRAALPEQTLQGMLMGFCDLVFEFEGRYWVLDYKSNSLGTADRDYHAGALEGAMAQHRYDVQAALYLLALHRLLGQRLGERYDPDQHLGGAIYLFMRGLRGPTGGSHVVTASRAFLSAMDKVVGRSRSASEEKA